MAVSKLVENEQALRPAVGRLVLLAVSLAGGLLGFFALAARVEGFWLLSRWPRVFVVVCGAALLGALFGLALRGGWPILSAPPRLGKLAWLAAVLAAGIMLKVLIPPPSAPILYTLEIVTPGPGASASEQVLFLELRDPQGRVVPPADLQVEGGWQRVPGGLAVQSGQAARLRYSFYAGSRGELRLLFGEQPGGQVLARLNGQAKQISLDGSSGGQRQVVLAFSKQSRWDLLLLLADMALLGLVLPVVVFVAPFAARARWGWAVPGLLAGARAAFSRLDAQKLFIAAFLLMAMLPLAGYKGDWSAIHSDFFGYRQLYDAYSFVRYNIFGDRLFDQVLIGKDGWQVLADKLSLGDYQRTLQFSSEELFQIQQRLDSTSAYFKGKGIVFLVVLIPDKNTIYPEMVPAQVAVIGKQSRLDQLLNYLQAHGGTPILDLRPALLRARQDHPVFYRTDSHWNPYGAYAGSVEILKALQKDFPSIQTHPLEDYQYTLDSVKLGDLGGNWVRGSAKETYFQLEPRFPRTIERFELLENRALYSFQYNNASLPGLPRAVVYHDSFMVWLEPFFSDEFSKATYIWKSMMDLSLIEGEKPEVVIYECTERYLEFLLNLPIVGDQGK